MSSKESYFKFPRRTFLSVSAATLGTLLFSHETQAQAPSSQESIAAEEAKAEAYAEYRVQNYIDGAAQFNVRIVVPDDQPDFTYVQFQKNLESWGVVDGNEHRWGNQETPLFAAMSGEYHLRSVPVLLETDNPSQAVLPSFEHNGKTWFYTEPTQPVIQAGKNSKIYRLESTSGDTFEHFHYAESLPAAVEQLDWSKQIAKTSAQSQEFFGYIRENNLINSDTVFFVACDGYHPSDGASPTHQVYDTAEHGLGEVKMSVDVHPTVAAAAQLVLTGNSEIKRITMERNDLVNTYLDERMSEVEKAKKEGRTLPIGVVCYPWDHGGGSIIEALKNYNLEELGLLFVISTPNQNVPVNIDYKQNKYLFVVTSSERELGYVPSDLSGGKLYEWPDEVPGLMSRPLLKSINGELVVGWMHEQVNRGGTSFAAWQFAIALGSIVCLKSQNSEQPTLDEVVQATENIFLEKEKQRGDTSYLVRQLNMDNFKNLAEGRTHTQRLIWTPNEQVSSN